MCVEVIIVESCRVLVKHEERLLAEIVDAGHRGIVAEAAYAGAVAVNERPSVRIAAVHCCPRVAVLKILNINVRYIILGIRCLPCQVYGIAVTLGRQILHCGQCRRHGCDGDGFRHIVCLCFIGLVNHLYTVVLRLGHGHRYLCRETYRRGFERFERLYLFCVGNLVAGPQARGECRSGYHSVVFYFRCY